jgi:carlactone synthase/all-trans-10'-apo-beta-carotenal 13,14-cleaving dioxygenase
VTEQQLEVTGTLPPWLSGQLMVNGGGDYSASAHMFDGFAFISKLRVQGGQAWGSQRYVNTKAYKAYKATGEALVIRRLSTRLRWYSLQGPEGVLLLYYMIGMGITTCRSTRC